MKILHTADLHLREYNDERWRTLRTVVEIAGKENVDFFIIGGDLFDSGIDAENLRTKMRKVFSKTPFETVVIQGNHDVDSFQPGTNFGDNFTVLSDPFKPIEREEVRIIGMPFESVDGKEVLSRILSLKKILLDTKINILVYHGELLDAFFSREEFGEEGKERHMPIKLSYFDELNITYVLAGHFHTRFYVKQLKNGGYFVYPGSPISITKKETGQRKVDIFDLGSPPRDYLLDTPHFEAVRVTLDPFVKQDPVEIVKRKLEETHPAAKILLTVDGYMNSAEINMTETQVIDEIKELTAGKLAEDPCLEIRDVKTILENSLFGSFLEKLKRLRYESEKDRVMRELAIRAMVSVKHED